MQKVSWVETDAFSYSLVILADDKTFHAKDGNFVNSSIFEAKNVMTMHTMLNGKAKVYPAIRFSGNFIVLYEEI